MIKEHEDLVLKLTCEKIAAESNLKLAMDALSYFANPANYHSLGVPPVLYAGHRIASEALAKLNFPLAPSGKMR